MIICFVFSSVSYFDASQDLVAKQVADAAKNELVAVYGKFPIKLDTISSLINITSNKQYVVYDYKVLMSSDKFTSEILAENLKPTLKDQICDEHDFVSFFKENDLKFLYNYQFSNKKTILVTLSIGDICD